MKEKNKKILKGLGVGALACVGMFGLTGCANIEVSQERIDSLIEMAERADARLDEYAGLLEKANRMTKEEVWNLAQTSEFNRVFNLDGARDNLIISMRGEMDGEIIEQDMMWYYNNDNFKMFAELDGDGNGVTGAELWYQTSESNVVLASIDKVENDYSCDMSTDRGETAVFEHSIGVYRGGCIGINSFGLTYEDINHYEILNNGNIRLYFIKDNTYFFDQEETEYIKARQFYSFEFSVDGKLLLIGMNSNVTDYSTGAETEYPDVYAEMSQELNQGYEMILRYGEINTELVESWVELAEAKRNEQ